MAENRFFIGIDDTDTTTTKGTGFTARELGKLIEADKLGRVVNITRHQLLISNRIKYTNRNNAACIEVISSERDEVISMCCNYLVKHTHELSNPVLVFSGCNPVSMEIIDFGKRAKEEVITLNEALGLSDSEGYTFKNIRRGKKGVIGALASIGLRASGNDGRVIWVNGHEVKGLVGTYLAGEVYCETHVDLIKTVDGFRIPSNAHIKFNDKRIKPILLDNIVTLLVEEIKENKNPSLICTNYKALRN